MFGALNGRFGSLASFILVVNVVGELQQKRTLAASRGFLAAARLSCLKDILSTFAMIIIIIIIAYMILDLIRLACFTAHCHSAR